MATGQLDLHRLIDPRFAQGLRFGAVQSPPWRQGALQKVPRSQTRSPGSAPASGLRALPEAEVLTGRCGLVGERADRAVQAPSPRWGTMDDASSSAGSGGFRPGVDSLDEPPNSRIFLVISKYTTELVLRERFSPFGDIQDIWVVRDKHTKESKGVAFIKFARSSQACRAMEEMHGQCLGPYNTKPIKVRHWD